MVFNGHRLDYVESLDEELFAEIQVMFADGLLGNRGVFDALAPITAGVFNYLRSSNSSALKSDQIFPWIHEYTINPDIYRSEELVNNSLLAFMTQAPGFDIKRFNNGIES